MEEIVIKVFEKIEDTINSTVRKDICSDQIIYHYTNCDALISILTDYKFWFSSVELMNDKDEVDYSIQIIEKSLNDIGIPNSKKLDLLENFKKYKKTSAINTFVLSLSLDNDSLILWNNYAKNDGYNLGLRLSTLLNTINEKNFEILNDNSFILVNGRMLYDEKSQRELLGGLLLNYYELYIDRESRGIVYPEIEENVEKIWKMIVLFSSLVKSNSHEHENEYRIVLTVPDDSKAVKFRSRNGIVLPYIEFKLKDFTSLEKVTIGPKINDQITEDVLDYFLEKKSLNKKIEMSSIKLRF